MKAHKEITRTTYSLTVEDIIASIPDTETVLLEMRISRAEANITWYIGQFEFWTEELERWIDVPTVEDMHAIPLEAMERNERLAQDNITLWWALQQELIIRRFEEKGGYKGEYSPAEMDPSHPKYAKRFGHGGADMDNDIIGYLR